MPKPTINLGLPNNECCYIPETIDDHYQHTVSKLGLDKHVH